METRKRNIVFDFENTQSRKYWLDTYRRTFSSCSFGFCLLCYPFCRLQFSRRRSFLLLLISLRLLLWERYIANAYWQTKYKTTDIQLWWTICITFRTNLFLLLFFLVLSLRIALLSPPFPCGVVPEYRVEDEEASGSFWSAAPGCDAEASEPSAYKRGSL